MPHAPPPRSVALFVVLLLAACRSEPGPGPSEPDVASTPSTVATADTGQSDPLTLLCSSDGHALRATCSWSGLAPPGVLTVGEGEGIELADAAGEVALDALRPNTTYDWRLERSGPTVEGRFVTPPLPGGALVRVEISGTPTVPLLGMKTPCSYDSAYIVLDVDPDLPEPEVTGDRPPPDAHRVLGYEYVSEHQGGFVEAVSFTEDDSVLSLSAFPGGVVELARDGELLLAIDDSAFFGPPHHDVFRRDGLTYVLVQDFTQGVYMDAIQVFDAQGAEVAVWRLADHLEPVVDGLGYLKGDYSHANSIWVDAAGDWYLSSRHLSAVFKIAGLHAPDAGAVRWTLVGDPDEVRVEGTLELRGGESFLRQHNVHLMPDGRLALFDNRRAFSESSRLLWLSIDEAAGTAEVDQRWSLPEHCPFQGGAWTTPSGTALATCAPRRTAFEFAPDTPDPIAQIEVTCAGASQDTFIPRMVPLESW